MDQRNCLVIPGIDILLLALHSCIVGAVFQTVAGADIAQRLLTGQRNLLALYQRIVDACKVIQNSQLHSTHCIEAGGNRIHGQRKVVIHFYALQQMLHRVDGIAATDLVVVIVNHVIGQGDLLGVRRNHRCAADRQLVDLCHGIAADLDGSALSCFVVEHQKQQKVCLNTGSVGCGNLRFFIAVQAQHQIGFQPVFPDIVLTFIADHAFFKPRLKRTALTIFPNRHQHEKGSYKENDAK